ncbi:MAG: hypothetical protein JWM57_837 [Phycisphaerales bacterium]|nr:hypothetical protein [Phycisphaerales bacterium]
MASRSGHLPRRITITALLVAIVPVASIVWFAIEFHRATAEITDVTRYPQVIADLKTQGIFASCPALQSLLPAALPANAKDITFWYQAGYAQGGASLALRYRLPPADYAALEATLLQSPALERRAAGDQIVWFRDRTNTKLISPEEMNAGPPLQLFGWKSTVQGAFIVKPNSVDGGLDFACCLDPARSEVNYGFTFVK